MTSKHKKNLIIGLGNLRFEDCEPFLASLWHTGFGGDVCFFEFDLHHDVRRRFEHIGVQMADGRDFIRSGRNIMNSRFFMILDFISNHRDDYQNIMVTDVRDVIFQIDPFLFLGNSSVVFASESKLIRDCPINRSWVAQAYGYGIYENIRDFNTSCAGTTIGTTEGILRYLTRMIDEMSTCSILHTNIDQGIHNGIVHMRPVPGAMLDSDCRIVATLSHIPDDRLAVTERGIELDGRLVPVVHQWDRNPKIASFVRGSERFKVGDPSATSVRFPSGWMASPPLSNPGRSSDLAILLFTDPDDIGGPARALAGLRAVGHNGQVVMATTMVIDPAAFSADNHVTLLTIPPEQIISPARILRAVLMPLIQTEPDSRVFCIINPKFDFIGDPFKAFGSEVCLFSEGAKLILHHSPLANAIAALGITPDHMFLHQIVSDRIFLGTARGLLRFQEAVDDLLSSRPSDIDVLDAFKAGVNIAGAVSPIADVSVAVYPNGAHVLFDLWPTELQIELGPVVKAGNGTPAIVGRRTNSPDAVMS